VTDVADALIMASLFGELWRQGVVVLATSNRAPHELYLDGLNRPYFLPFIDLLARQCAVVDMVSGMDHRTQFRGAGVESYFTPLDAYVHAYTFVGVCVCILTYTPLHPRAQSHNRAASARLDAAYLALTDNHPGVPTTIPVMMGRSLRVPRAHDGACRFAFADLCKADVFAADFHAVCARFHTVVLEGVPTLSTEVCITCAWLRGAGVVMDG
jgi:cell division protein ZapE